MFITWQSHCEVLDGPLALWDFLRRVQRGAA